MSGKDPIEVVINGKFLLAPIEGMPRVGREVCAKLDELLRDDRFSHVKIIMMTPKGGQTAASFDNIAINEVGCCHGLIWEQVEFPYYLGSRYSLNFTGTAPVIRRNGCVVVHDAQFFSSPGSHGWKSRLLYGVISPIVARHYRHVVTVSDYARQELSDYDVTRRPDVAVIHLGADHLKQRECDASILETHGLSEKGFLLTNSYVQTHKNVATLFQALKDDPVLRSKLVLFGTSTRQDYERRGIPVPDEVIFVGRIPDQQLVALMKNARMFLFPSLTEGFGLPPLEAMALGCPTICANAGAMPEVCGAGALYAEARVPLDWHRKIKDLWCDDAALRRLSENGQQQASHYTWRRAAEKYLELICGLASNVG